MSEDVEFLFYDAHGMVGDLLGFFYDTGRVISLSAASTRSQATATCLSPAEWSATHEVKQREGS
jgi:hypothetical protein